MTFSYSTKKVLVVLLAIVFCMNIHADILPFKAGQKAAYTLTQKLDSDIAIFSESDHVESNATIDLDVEILSANEETASYPFDVKITLKKIIYTEIQQDSNSTHVISYDSDIKGRKVANTPLLTEHFQKIIDHPLYFRVEKDFQVKEIGNYLTTLNEDFESPSLTGLFGATHWTYELFLTQLFHLSGENLTEQKSYPASCYQLLNWEDEAMDEDQVRIYQESNYIIDSINSKGIYAFWQGNAKAIDLHLFSQRSGDVTVTANVTIDAAKPLVQQRTLKVEMEDTASGLTRVTGKISAEQTWQSVLQ